MKTFRKQITYILSVSCFFICARADTALSSTMLRPAATTAEEAHTSRGITEELIAKTSSAGTATYKGISNAVPATIIGKAAIFSSYSAYDILRNIQHGSIKAERDNLLSQAIEDISKAIKVSTVSNAEEALRALSSYYEKVSAYFSERLTSTPDKNRLIRNSIGTLEFFLCCRYSQGARGRRHGTGRAA